MLSIRQLRSVAVDIAKVFVLKRSRNGTTAAKQGPSCVARIRDVASKFTVFAYSALADLPKAVGMRGANYRTQ
jgi:hypothetical protein